MVALAACGGDDDGGGEEGASSEACPSGALEIKMADIKFDPKDATASVGQQGAGSTRTRSSTTRSPTSSEFESELFGKGKTFTATVDAPGEIPYVCTVHPGMTGTLTVERCW